VLVRFDRLKRRLQGLALVEIWRELPNLLTDGYTSTSTQGQPLSLTK
jgi:hypothetical protein